MLRKAQGIVTRARLGKRQSVNGRSSAASGEAKAVVSIDEQVKTVLASLKRLGSKKDRDGMARYGLPSDNAFGVPMAAMQKLSKDIGRNHELALGLWETGWYEARTVAAFIDEPKRVTAAQMDRWCRDFDNWGICDTVCFHLFDRTPHAYRKVEQWAGKNDEFVKRATFALLACLALHDKQTEDETFLRYLPLIERAATDERNFVKKGVSWALRLIGRRSKPLNVAAVELSQRLSTAKDPTAKWLGKSALKELTGPVVKRALKSKASGK